MQILVKDDSGEIIGMIGLESKDFKTGSRGFHGVGKIAVNGKKYQGNFMLVEIRSKPQAKTVKK